MSTRNAPILLISLCLTACGSTKDKTPLTFPNAGDAQTPPTSGDATAMQAWLDTGSYKNWHCEAAAHDPRGPSMHGMNRACSNDLASAFNGASGTERPAGTASVKEFWKDGKIIGRAANVKMADESDGGASWYWFVELYGMGVLANGNGKDDTVAKDVCVSCHSSAGSDPAHTTSAHSRDFVYTQVN